MDTRAFQAYFDTMPIAFTIIELVLNEYDEPVDFIFRYANPALAALEGVALEELKGKRFFGDIFPQNNDKKWLKYYYSSAFRNKIYELHEHSPEIGKHLNIICYPWLAPGYCACILTDESELVAARKQLEVLALQDQATTFRNRNSYLDFCHHFEPSHNVGVIFIDINGLKATNDQYGHRSGDALIQMVSTRIAGLFTRDGCNVFRIGGDEFVVVLSDVSQEDCQAQAERLIQGMQNTEVPQFPRVLASVGWSWESWVICIEDLVKAADEHMYQQKRTLSGAE